MKSENFRPIFLLANLVIINWVVIYYLNLNYPFVGHDYSLAIPSLLDSALHFRINGLVIQWFTPSFGGGIPAFPNPNNMQFSLPAFLSILLSPWQAVILSIVIYISVGFIACEYFLRHTLKMNWTTSILGAVFFSANGFIIERVAVGHLGYHTFPLLTIFLIVLLEDSLSPLVAAAIVGLTSGILLQSAGYFILIVFGFSILIVFPIIYLYNPSYFKWKRWLFILSVGGAIGLLVSASKLTAVFAFMRFFPRTISDHYSTTPLLGLVGLILQLLGTMNLAPLFRIVGLKPDIIPAIMVSVTQADYGFWEMDMSVTPIVFAILLVGLYVFLRYPKKYLNRLLNKQNKIALIFLILFLWIAIEFTLAKGFIYPLIRHLPIISSLHVNVRFAAAFIFPLALVAAILYNNWANSLHSEKLFSLFVITNILAILPLGAYFLFKTDLLYRIYDAREGQTVYEQIQSGTSLDVTNISLQSDNTEALLTHSSNLNLYEPVFGYKLEFFHPEVTPGSIWSLSDGYFNMTNPTGYVYPEINSNRPFERFQIKDKDTLVLFAKHIQPNWEIPNYQQILDWISTLAFITTLAYIIFHGSQHAFSKAR